MFSKFLNIETETQEYILNAAMKEFADKGFENASTNDIVKEANISKGLLFYYFKNKKYLFLFLYNFCINLYINEFYKKINMNEADIFMKSRQSSLLKLELLIKHPDIFVFIESVNRENSQEIRSALEPIKS